MHDPRYDVTITTDGSGTRLGQPGGWACILRTEHLHKELWGGKDSTTNNEMELYAILAGITALLKPQLRVLVRSDSQVALGWAQGGWRKSGHPYARAIGQTLTETITDMRLLVGYRHVPGHAGDPDNERADLLAGAERDRRMLRLGFPVRPDRRKRLTALDEELVRAGGALDLSVFTTSKPAEG